MKSTHFSNVSIREGFQHAFNTGEMKPEWKDQEESVVKTAADANIHNVDALIDILGDEEQWNGRSVPRSLEKAPKVVEHCLYAIANAYSRSTLEKIPGFPKMPPYWKSMGL